MLHPFRYPFALQAQNSPHCAQRGAPARLQGIFHSTKRPVDNRHRRQRRAATAAGKRRGASRGGRETQQTRSYSSSGQELKPHNPHRRHHQRRQKRPPKDGCSRSSNSTSTRSDPPTMVWLPSSNRCCQRLPKQTKTQRTRASGTHSRLQEVTSPECVRTAQPRAMPYRPSCYNETSSSVTLCQEHGDWYTQPNQPKQSFSAYTKASRRLGQYRPSTQQPKSTA